MLKAVLFDFNGVIINDEAIHRRLVDDLLLQENLRPMTLGEYQQFALGRSDRAALRDLWAYRGRSIREDYLTKLIQRKALGYRQALHQLDPLPFYPGLQTFLERLSLRPWERGLVTGAIGSEVDYVLERGGLLSYFPVRITGEDVAQSKPQPEGYLLALAQLQQRQPDLLPQECLAIEDSWAGIQSAKAAGMQVLGLAHTYPYHFLQRWANWAVDSFTEIDLDRIEVVMARRSQGEA
jgi:HAD superfamily hydrolase (TIGR01509 family)